MLQAPNLAACWTNWRTAAEHWDFLSHWAIFIRSTCFGSSCRLLLMYRVTGCTCKRKQNTFVTGDLTPKGTLFWLGFLLLEYFTGLRSTMMGKTSHKFFDPNENFIMRLYYQKDVLTFMCFCNEMFYSGLYLLHFTNGPTCKWAAFFVI